MKPEAGVASGSWAMCVPNASLKKLKVEVVVWSAVGIRQMSFVEPHPLWAATFSVLKPASTTRMVNFLNIVFTRVRRYFTVKGTINDV